MTNRRTDIGVDLVRRLVAGQFPQWAELPLEPAEPAGWDNHTFRLGADLSVRLPSAERYVAQVEKEHRWLPRLAPHLPMPIPTPVAMGVPAEGYPWPWSIYRWIEGEVANIESVTDMTELATALAEFLTALQGIDARGGPAAGPHNFFRGGPLDVYDREARDATASLRGHLDRSRVLAVWSAALETAWNDDPVWVHGDVSATNLLLKDGRLRAVIDFGSSGVGDPACDTAIAWTLFTGESRNAFHASLPLDDATWARGRGWALWKALTTLAGDASARTPAAREARRIIDDVLAEHEEGPTPTA